MTTSFHNQTAIVTGGASGIGRALCEELARRGAMAVVADIDDEGAQAVASAIAATGGRATAAPLDVTRAADVERLVEDTVRAHVPMLAAFLRTAGDPTALGHTVQQAILAVDPDVPA